ncbi:oligosaccharyltransferase OST48 [Salpingoeca rosetta]|uniref:Dolichyl-diphosphooligosaccharide--protein glycosyltransferase 48 kDa subunit n=1 Tax=Salpingoeca rosetta (strain ATCC 50818 / BSB-021) TaxID=946362 RepID=F2UF93_SALR5|nr:oligosaccharyltransferase OST48 [Salpingoeca rosetta]EGD75293.1 oligosaccharyltransferase OST48 [Salpingoeca rosetta]|eukprot:XP_004992346.1 oligosaccharyltransferase OST48 [Salpingoeca rosetta]
MTMMRVAVVLSVLLLGCMAFSASAQRTLVLLDSASTRETHSHFFSRLSDAGLSLKYVQADSASLNLHRYGERLFDNVIVFSPSVEQFGGSVSAEEMVDFVDNGGNVLVAGSEDIGAPLRDFASEVGFEFDEAGNAVIDHVSHADDDHTLVASTNVVDVEVMTGGALKKPVLFRGVGMIADDANPLAVSVLRASSTAYTGAAAAGRSADEPLALGGDVVLAGAMQARNNARVVLTGSIDMFSNELIFHDNAANEQFVEALALWCFQERGQLRTRPALHRLVGNNESSHEYTITDEVEYFLPIEEKVNGEWVPYTGNDVQLEFVRIDPFVRTPLKNVDGVQQVTFTLPDVYGVFQFRVDYNRLGYTHIYNTQQVSVRPLRHTQYERFISTAYPYYANAFSMMAALFLFSFVFLHHRP